VDKQITKGCSLEVMQFENKVKGALQHVIRESTLMVAPRLAASLFCFHSAVLCHDAASEAEQSHKP
jgi:hypothetical protein